MQKLLFLFACGFFIFILWVIYMANTGQSSVFFELVSLIPYGDKVGHFMLFGILTLTANIGLQFKALSFGKLQVFWGATFVLIFAGLEELSQHFSSRRTLDLSDFIADVAGIALFSLLTTAIQKKYFQKVVT